MHFKIIEFLYNEKNKVIFVSQKKYKENDFFFIFDYPIKNVKENKI